MSVGFEIRERENRIESLTTLIKRKMLSKLKGGFVSQGELKQEEESLPKLQFVSFRDTDTDADIEQIRKSLL